MAQGFGDDLWKNVQAVQLGQNGGIEDMPLTATEVSWWGSTPSRPHGRRRVRERRAESAPGPDGSGADRDLPAVQRAWRGYSSAARSASAISSRSVSLSASAGSSVR